MREKCASSIRFYLVRGHYTLSNDAELKVLQGLWGKGRGDWAFFAQARIMRCAGSAKRPSHVGRRCRWLAVWQPSQRRSSVHTSVCTDDGNQEQSQAVAYSSIVMLTAWLAETVSLGAIILSRPFSSLADISSALTGSEKGTILENPPKRRSAMIV